MMEGVRLFVETIATVIVVPIAMFTFAITLYLMLGLL